MNPLEHRELIKSQILGSYNDIQKSDHTMHKYIRKEGDKYIYEEPKNNLHHIKNDIPLHHNTEPNMVDSIKKLMEGKQPKKVKDTLQSMINYLVAPEIPEREFSKLFNGIDHFRPHKTPAKYSIISAHTGERVELGDHAASLELPVDAYDDYKNAFGMSTYFHNNTSKVVEDFKASIERLEAFKSKYKGQFDTSFVDQNIAEIKRALPIAEAMNELQGKMVTTKELNRRAKKEAMPYDWVMINNAVNENPVISETLDKLEARYIDHAQKYSSEPLDRIKKDAEYYRDAVVGNLVNAVGKITNGAKLESFKVHQIYNGKGGLEGTVSVNGKFHELQAIYASGAVQRLHIRFLIK